MVAVPAEDPDDKNPIKLLEEFKIKEIYENYTYDFASERKTLKTDDSDANFEFEEQTERLRMSLGNHLDVREFDSHTSLVHDFFRYRKVLEQSFICRNKAFLKLCEIFDNFPTDIFQKKDFRSFHLCEGPGYFIEATYYHFLRSKSPGTWSWAANTLNPYFENTSCLDKLVDDSHIRRHMNKWFFGPDDDGDVAKLTEKYLNEHKLSGTFDLVTADGSTNTNGREHEKERIVAKIIRAEVQTALQLLRTGGRLVLKVFRFCNPDTQDVMRVLADNFSTIKAFKPISSRPGSSEKYIICDGFGGQCYMDKMLLVDCDEKYLSHQLIRIRYANDTYASRRVPYTWQNRNDFIADQRPKLFTAQYADYQKTIGKMFPIGVFERRSPWMNLYGSNLIRRHQFDIPTAVEQYINTAPVFEPPYDYNVPDVLEKFSKTGKICVTSNVRLETNDSFFIEPIAYLAIRHHEPKVYYDYFEKYAQINRSLQDAWRDHLLVDNTSDPGKTHYKLEMHESISIEHVIILLNEVFVNKVYSLTLVLAGESTAPLYLSRLSASMFVLMYMVYKSVEYREPGVMYYSQPRSCGPVLHHLIRLRQEMSEMRDGTSVRSFLPISLLALYHSIICFKNLGHLTSIYHKYQTAVNEKMDEEMEGIEGMVEEEEEEGQLVDDEDFDDAESVSTTGSFYNRNGYRNGTPHYGQDDSENEAPVFIGGNGRWQEDSESEDDGEENPFEMDE
ncbi:unnamed protein product [Caenorhabditis sp. 36 PRJEB53466]|nr:unnamed protein product [Caenorhabditis sp. 36 PRJEB53466]